MGTENWIQYGGNLGPALSAAVSDANARRNNLLKSNLPILDIRNAMERMTAAERMEQLATDTEGDADDLLAQVQDTCGKLTNAATTAGDMNNSVDKLVARLKISNGQA